MSQSRIFVLRPVATSLLMIGILFAFVLGLPFGHLSLVTASTSLFQDVVWNAELFTTMLHILAPFLLGFSTTLVLSIL